MEIDINNIKHWHLAEDGELAGHYVQRAFGVQLNGSAMALVIQEAEAERRELEARGHKVAIIQPKGDYTSFSEAIAKLKELGREDDLGLLEHLRGVDAPPSVIKSP